MCVLLTMKTDGAGKTGRKLFEGVCMRRWRRWGKQREKEEGKGGVRGKGRKMYVWVR